MMRFFEKYPKRPTGRLVFDVFQRGERIEHFNENNLVVNGYKAIHAHLLGGDVSGHIIAQIGFGTNGSTPTVGNTQLTSAFIKPLDTISYPTLTSVRFDFTLAADEANGKAIREFGLLTDSGTLYARRIRSVALDKNADISLSGFWTIEF